MIEISRVDVENRMLSSSKQQLTVLKRPTMVDVGR